MNPWHDPTFVQLLCGGTLLAVLGLNVVMSPRSDATVLTAGLFLLWRLEWMLLVDVPHPPDPIWLLPMLDLAGALGVLLCRASRDRPWKAALMWTFVVALGLLALEGLGDVFFPSLMTHEAKNTFTAARMVVFFAQCGCALWPGGARVVARVRYLLSGRSDHGHSLGSAR